MASPGKTSNENEDTNALTAGFFLGLLELPKYSVIQLDNSTVQLQRDDFCGFSSIPPRSNNNNNDTLHLVTVRGGHERQQQTTVGYWFDSRNLVLKYNAYMEELDVCSDVTTCTNLLQSYHTLPPQRVVPYSSLLNDTKQAAWQTLTRYISESLLHRRRIRLHQKLVPGSVDDDGETNEPNELHESSAAYPPIPVVTSIPSRTLLQHDGTRSFLKHLTTTQRTAFFTDPCPSQRALQYCLEVYYDQNIELLLGDLQLAFCLFLNLHCYQSLCHWRDLICMLSNVADPASYSTLYQPLLEVLTVQLNHLDGDLLETEDNCLVPALQALLQHTNELLQTAASQLTSVVFQKYPSTRVSNAESADLDGNSDCQQDKEDGPVVVDTNVVQASWERTQHQKQSPLLRDPQLNGFPILRAAMLDNEDVLMTCARALDNQNDVSLVREAAEYLETVEAKRTQ